VEPAEPVVNIRALFPVVRFLIKGKGEPVPSPGRIGIPSRSFSSALFVIFSALPGSGFTSPDAQAVKAAAAKTSSACRNFTAMIPAGTASP